MTLNQKMFKSTAALLVYCLVNVFVLVGLPGGTLLAQTSAPVSGILKIIGPGTVLINGNTAADGATVLPDSQIQTQDTTQAVINFPRLGLVEVGCNSLVKVTFTSNSIDVIVTSGFAKLTTDKGTDGSLAADGKVLKTDRAIRSSVESLTANPCGKVKTPGTGGPFGGAGLIAIIGGAAGAAVIIGLATRGDNVVSPVR